jgi:hypothetical protein
MHSNSYKLLLFNNELLLYYIMDVCFILSSQLARCLSILSRSHPPLLMHELDLLVTTNWLVLVRVHLILTYYSFLIIP